MRHSYIFLAGAVVATATLLLAVPSGKAPEILRAASADQTFTYGPGTYDVGRLSDELIATPGISLITIRGTDIPGVIEVVVADGVQQSVVTAVVNAHNPLAVKANDLILVRRNAANDGYEIGRLGGPWNAWDPDLVKSTRKEADQSNSSNVNFADVTGLSFPVAANKVYDFDFTIYFTTAAAQTGLVLSVNGPSSPVAVRYSAQIGESATAWRTVVQTAYDQPVTGTTSTAGTALVAHVRGTIQTNSAGGTLVVRFRSEVNGSAVTILRGSVGSLRS